MVILDIDRDIPDAGSLESIFFLQGFRNPYYAASVNDHLQIYTIAGEQEVEHTIYQNMLPYSPGSLSNVRVVGKRYEANFIDVEYSWLFQFDNDIPPGGMIDLIFPKNFYNVQDSIPTPTFQVLLGLQSATGHFQQSDASQSVNVYTISNFQRYTRNTLISLRVRGVKNPPVEGLTNYFEIKSKTKEAYEIDYKRDIDALYILRPIASGQVTFNDFSMSPDNGSPEGDIFPANYRLSFYPKRDIPKYGYIEITFPLTEFVDSSAFLNKPLRCYISGAITTF